MESKRTATKKVIKSGGRKKKGPIERPIDMSIAKEKVEPIERPIDEMPIAVENIAQHRERLKGVCLPIAPHISKDFHYALLDIPNHAIHDLGYIHFHLFTVWFFSKFNIPIPNDLHAIYISHFSLFPFFSALFHIRNNL